MAQQTAVAILEEKLKTYLSWSSFLEEDFEQAKAIEKENIIKARQDGLDNGFSNGSWDSNLYYNETFTQGNE